MGSVDRSRKRDILWKKAIIHFSLCFVMGFFSGIAPTTTTDTVFFSRKPSTHISVKSENTKAKPAASLEEAITFNRSFMAQAVAATAIEPNATTSTDELPEAAESESESEREERTENKYSTLIDGEEYEKLLILVTTTSSHDPFKPMLLKRLAHTLRLVPPPLLWIVVQARPEAQRTEEMLRMTGIMYRHLVFNENFTDVSTEIDFQRNYALNHIEHHRLDGVVHFAELSNVYDLRFFDEIRNIKEFGTWPIASVSTNRKRVTIEGPVCQSSEVMGWHWKDNNNSITRERISSFAFNSSILWDPERWGRTSSVPVTSQDSIKFVQEVLLEDDSKLMAVPQDCSLVMVWHLHVHCSLFLRHSTPYDPDNNQSYNR